jgi:hypothetical protein
MNSIRVTMSLISLNAGILLKLLILIILRKRFNDYQWKFKGCDNG